MATPVIRAALPFFPLSAVKPGQKGVGYTVVYGTEVKPFAVEILGVTESKSKGRSYILVKVSGNIFHETKGIAAGMSGSPVFIEGRLAGAISYAFDRSDPQYGMATPIEDMLRLWDTDYLAEAVTLAPEPALPAGCRVAIPVATPLLVSSRRSPEELDRLASRFGFTVVTTSGALGVGSQPSPRLQPGSAVAAAFALGDYNAVAVGTVTWVDGKRFLAFGHPVANRGLVDYLAAGVFVHQVIASADMPFKLGAPLSPVGRFVQDRGAGVSGLLDEAADTVLVKATVQDKGSGRHGTYQTAVVREPTLLRSMCIAALLDAMDQTLDQYAAGSARVTLRIDGEGLGQPVVRRNLFYDGKDVGAAALSEVGAAIDLLTQNDFQDVRLHSIALEVSFTPTPLVANVIEARADRTKVKPGEKVQVEVEVRPFRAIPYIVPFTLTIPANAEPGKLILSVRGGYVRRQEEGQEKQADLSALFLDRQPDSLAGLIASFTDQPRNNDLILEYLPFSREQEPEGGESDTEPVVLIQGCDFVVMGQTQLILELQAPNSTEQKQTG